MNWYIIILCYNAFVFLIFGLDKLFAMNKHRRISERTLLLLSFFFGAVGAMFGMVVFCHKTRKMKFRLLVPLFVVLNIVLVEFAIKYGCGIL